MHDDMDIMTRKVSERETIQTGLSDTTASSEGVSYRTRSAVQVELSAIDIWFFHDIVLLSCHTRGVADTAGQLAK